MAREVYAGADILDSRDIQKRIDELESLRDDAKTDAEALAEEIKELEEKLTKAKNDKDSDPEDLESLREELAEKRDEYSAMRHSDSVDVYYSDDFGEDEHEELKKLEAFKDDANAYEWREGTTFIHEDYFEKYAEELAEDLYGKEVRDAHWPFDCIDWEKAADALKMDYSTAEFDGETYYFRS